MINIYFFKSNNFPPLFLKENILYFIKFLPFRARMPIITINLYNDMKLWQGKITGIFTNTIFRFKGNLQFFKSIINYNFWLGRALAISTCPRTQTLPRTKSEFMKFGWLYPYFFITPFTFAELASPKWVRCTRNSLFIFMRAFAATKFASSHFAFVNLVGIFTKITNKSNLILFIPRCLSFPCYMCLHYIYSSLVAMLFTNHNLIISQNETGDK